jgi:hypothetical protein
LFASSSFGFVYSVSQSLFCQHQLLWDWHCFEFFCDAEALFSCFCVLFLSRWLAMLPFASASSTFLVICWIWFFCSALFLVCLLSRLLVLCIRSLNLCSAQTSFSEIRNVFTSFVLPRLCSHVSASFFLELRAGTKQGNGSNRRGINQHLADFKRQIARRRPIQGSDWMCPRKSVGRKRENPG